MNGPSRYESSRDYAVWLYGSCARGDADELSDVDLLLLGDVPERELTTVRQAYSCPLSLSRYSWSEISTMCGDGSVFLHHVRREGKVLVERGPQAVDFRSSLGSLPRYRHVTRDLRSFRVSVADVRNSLECGGSTYYELTVLVSTIRHAAILGCYLLDRITFGRSEALATVADAWALDGSHVSAFENLYRLSLRDQRDLPSGELPEGYSPPEWADFAEELLDRLEVNIENLESNLSATT